MTPLHRNITSRVLAALADTPVVVIHGPRRAGKSTLAQALAAREHPARYLTLDNAGVLSAAANDPEGFVAHLQGRVVLDEIQRAPNLMLAIKADVDRNPQPGRFLLTGSANVLHLPRLADSLAGRMEVLSLWPFSQGELEGTREGFIDAMFADVLPGLTAAPGRSKKAGTHTGEQIMERVLVGGYPEAVARKAQSRRANWFDSYLEAILLRDVRDLANIEGVTDLPRLLAAVAGRAAGLLNYAELGRDVGLSQMTVKRYFSLLEATFLVRTVRPWFTNRIKRVMKSPKLYVGDTGLLAHLLNIGNAGWKADPNVTGPLIENFVVVELMKQRTWSETRPDVFHFRDYASTEVDLVLEARGGHKIVGIEIKAGATPGANDFKGLRALAEAAGKRFHRGVVLYTGPDVIPFGRNLHAMPIGALWQTGSINPTPRSLRATGGAGA